MAATVMNVTVNSILMSTTITVSDHVYDVLDDIKQDRDHQTYDSVLREVLRDADHDV